MHNKDYLYAVRCRYGKSRKEIADSLGMDISNYCRIENGRLAIQPIHFKKLKEVMPSLDLNTLYDIKVVR